MQAGILAGAGIITRIIGLLYTSPLKAIIGAEGMGYYSTAYNIYTMILLISSYSIPSAISKVIAQKLALKEYRNAHRIFLCSIFYVLIIGGAASLILFFGAGIFVQGAAVPVLKVLAPTVFFSGLLGVMRGYFQAHKSMAQTSVSQILEQILNAAVSIGGAVLLINHFMGTMEWNGNKDIDSERSMYGAIGSAMGTGAGVLTALLFIWIIYVLNRRLIHRRIERDRTQYEDSWQDIFRMIIAVITPFILSTAVYNLSTSINQTIYTKMMYYLYELDNTTIHYNFGILQESVKISNIPIAFATAMASAMIPSISQYVAKKNLETAKGKIRQATKITMIISIPCAIGLCVLARPIIGLLYNQKDTIDMSSRLLMAISVSVIFYALSTLSNSILQGIGKVNIPVINSGIALALQTIVVVLLLMFTDCDLYTFTIANTIYSFTVCVLNQMSIRKAIAYRQEVKTTFIIPLVAAGIMGAIVWAVYELLHMLTSSNTLSLIPAILIGVCLYFALLIVLKGVNEEELRSFPKGHLLVKAAKKIRLIH